MMVSKALTLSDNSPEPVNTAAAIVTVSGSNSNLPISTRELRHLVTRISLSASPCVVSWGSSLDSNIPLHWINAEEATTSDGRPHVTPLLGVWQDGAVHFRTGLGEQKVRNLEQNQ